MNAHELIEKAREAQELLDRTGLGKRRSALDVDPQWLLKTIQQARNPQIEYVLRKQQVDEEAMERFLRDQLSRTEPKKISLHIRLAVDDDDENETKAA